MYEFVDRNGYAGMLVIGDGVDRSFRQEADRAGRPDEKLLDTTVEIALQPEVRHAVAIDRCASLAASQLVTIEAA